MNECQVLGVTFSTTTNKECFIVNFYILRVIHCIFFDCIVYVIKNTKVQKQKQNIESSCKRKDRL